MITKQFTQIKNPKTKNFSYKKIKNKKNRKYVLFSKYMTSKECHVSAQKKKISLWKIFVLCGKWASSPGTGYPFSIA